VRYMDDFVLFAESNAFLRECLSFVDGFLRDSLHLRLKAAATQLAPVRNGVPFLGWRIYSGTTRIRPQNLRRLRARLEHRRWEYRTGRIGQDRLIAAVRSTIEHLRHGSTLGLRRAWLPELALLPGAGGQSQLGGDGSPANSNRVIRGGSYGGDAASLRSANRNNNDPGNRNDNIGFRLAKAPQGQNVFVTRSGTTAPSA